MPEGISDKAAQLITDARRRGKISNSRPGSDASSPAQSLNL